MTIISTYQAITQSDELAELHRHIGGLEIDKFVECKQRLLHRHIGGLENNK